ncbi:hypothetical protein Taro_035887 [Colocasia esculenta]|uniref:Uncharacterized protein n=1 Tax=Colocasia esculenta TaxID=4460 RepID=A0A843VVT0_COLES|nr:hypothetical protein [Colocasia esculenta]
MAEEAGCPALPLHGRAAIVTGASRGIGRAIAAHLASLGAHVLVNYAANAAQADLLVSELNASYPVPAASPPRPRAIPFRADVSSAADVKAMFDAAEQAFGGPAHILVACAGVLDAKYPPLAATSEEDWDKAFAVNTRGSFLCCREAANRLVRGGGGRIITVSTSLVGTLLPGYAAYVASKAAVEATTKILAKELRGTQITANSVAPGPVASDLFFAGKSEEDVRRVAAMVPLGRLGEPGDIAPVVGFLATDAADSPARGLPLHGRAAIVTGASRGIGRAIAAHLASLGAHVLVNYAGNAAQADLLVSELNASYPVPASSAPRPRAIPFRADVSSAADVKAMFDAAEKAFGGPAHILVACAGVLDEKYPALAATTEEVWDTAFAVNAKGAFLCCREAANRLVRGGGGRIIVISSSAIGALRPGFGAYVASKAAVEAMTKILAKELRGTQITANCVAPGPVATDMFFAGKSEEDVKKAVEVIPLGRLGETSDIAPVVGFMATDASEWVNGQVIRANGGYV